MSAVVLVFETLDHQVGLWCETCALPSASRLLATITAPGRAPVLHTLTGCSSCEPGHFPGSGSTDEA